MPTNGLLSREDPPMNGILAVFNNCAPGPGDDYEQWYNRQHLFERLSVPGFLSGRRYEARSGDRRYFSYYETVGDAVLRSAPYLARLDNPTEWTQRIMPSFTDTIRTVCHVAHREGRLHGAHAVTVRDHGEGGDGGAALARLAALGRDMTGVVSIQTWAASAGQTPPTREARNRPAPDRMVQGVLMLDCLRAADAEAAGAALRQAAEPGLRDTVGVYALLCTVFPEQHAA
jgi:hypothetical protein